MSHVVFQLKIFRTFQQKSPTQRSGLYHMWFSRSTFSIRFSKKVLLIGRGICLYVTCGFPAQNFQDVSARKSYSSIGVYVTCGFPAQNFQDVWPEKSNPTVGVYEPVVFQADVWGEKSHSTVGVYVACGFPGLRFISTWSKCQQGSWSLFTTYMAAQTPTPT
jgi:hypothetical protein